MGKTQNLTKGGDADLSIQLCRLATLNPPIGGKIHTVLQHIGGGRMSKRFYALLSVLVLASLALAACGPQAAAFTCTDKIGCVTIGPNDPIHIAYLLVVSGPNE